MIISAKHFKNIKQQFYWQQLNKSPIKNSILLNCSDRTFHYEQKISSRSTLYNTVNYSAQVRNCGNFSNVPFSRFLSHFTKLEVGDAQVCRVCDNHYCFFGLAERREGTVSITGEKDGKFRDSHFVIWLSSFVRALPIKRGLTH